MPYRKDLEVGLSIGTNCPKAIKPREVIPGSDDDLCGIKTDLGWGIVGRVCKSNQDFGDQLEGWTNKIIINKDTNLVIESRVKEVITPLKAREMFERDFHEASK